MSTGAYSSSKQYFFRNWTFLPLTTYPSLGTTVPQYETLSTVKGSYLNRTERTPSNVSRWMDDVADATADSFRDRDAITSFILSPFLMSASGMLIPS